MQKYMIVLFNLKEGQTAADYEASLLRLVEGLGEPILSNYRKYTFRADGAPQYRAPDAAPPPASPEVPA